MEMVDWMDVRVWFSKLVLELTSVLGPAFRLSGLAMNVKTPHSALQNEL